MTARYVVGTDGHHSTVRDALGLGFPGRSVVRSLMLADVQVTEAPGDILTVVGNGEGFCFLVPLGDGWYRVIARDPRRDLPDDAPIPLEEVRDLARRVLGTDYGMHSPRWMSRFHSEERQVTRFRSGRVFLAGDAAHVHSPAGGMGMNTGLQDAASLSWKLAAVLDGRAEEAQLDTYEVERKPIGAEVLRTSGGLIRAAMLRGLVTRRLRDGVLRPVTSRAVLRISGIGLRYPSPPGQSDLVGQRAPDLTDRAGRRLHQSLAEGRFALAAPEAVARRYPSTRWLTTFTPTEDTDPVLVRPDGYVAWAGPAVELEAVIGQWGLRSSRPMPAPQPGPDGTSTLRAIFGFHVRVNGQAEPRYMLTRGGWNGDEAVVRRSDTKERVDCTPGLGGPLDTSRPGFLRLHPRKDTVRFLVPLSCLPGVRTVSFTGYTADSRAGSPRTDHAYRRGTEVSRWSRWFAVR